MKNIQSNFENQHKQHNNKNEGDITINSNPNRDKKIKKDEGDYVDFEELDE